MEEMEEIETIKKDLKFQLTFEHMNWDYFIEMANKAKKLADANEVNFLE